MKKRKALNQNDRRKRSFVRAAYDSAQTTPDNRRHWAFADSYSADAAARPEIRKIIRNRARYEYANNAYAKGLALTVAGDVIGTGPVLSLDSPDAALRKKIEYDWCTWSEAIHLAEKIRTMRLAKLVDGESFAMFVENDQLSTPCRLDLVVIEADRVTSDFYNFKKKENIDGITLNELGYPVSYQILQTHPGDLVGDFGEFRTYGADQIIHWFRSDRPEQHRGVSELASALPLFAQLRRYTSAVLSSAETAADFAMILYTNSPDVSVEEFDHGTAFPLERNMMNLMPAGWQAGQLDPKQPINTYPAFKREVLGEIARCLQVPVNIMTGDSSQHNYASGRLDFQTYYRSIRIQQSACAANVLDPLFRRWLYEYRLVTGVNAEEVSFSWIFDGFEHVDPKKEAEAQAMRLAGNMTTLAYEYAKLGKDWEEEVRQIAKERKMLAEWGITINTETKNVKQTEVNDDELDD